MQTAKPRLFYGYVVVLTGLMIMIALWGSRFAFGVFFNPVLAEFGWTRAMLSGAFSLSMLVEGLVGMVMGGLTDKLGPRIVLTLTGAFLGIGYLLMSQLGADWQLYLFYGVFIGIGMSASFVPLLTTVSRWFVARRATMTGIVLSGTGIGALIAAPAAERLIAAYNWRLSYIITGVIVLIVVITLSQYLKRDPGKMGLTPYGEVRGQESLRSGGFTLKEAALTRQFWFYFGMLVCYGYCMFTVMVHIVPHVISIGISPAVAASVLAVIGAFTIAGRLLLGGVADKIGNKRIFVLGFSLMFLAFLWLIVARELWMLYISAGILGFVQAGMGVSEAPFIAKVWGLKAHGMIFGLSGVGFTTGSAIGPIVTGYIFDVTNSYQLAFTVSAVFAAVALACILAVTPLKNSPIKPGQRL